MTKQEAQDLLDRYADGTCTPEEKNLVERWYLSESRRQKLPDTDMLSAKSEIWGFIREANSLEGSRTKIRKITLRIMAAASFIAAVGSGLYFYQYHGKAPQLTQREAAEATNYDVNPGGDKATLTLADGSKILLDDTGNGLIATQAGIRISKLSDGTITYEVPGVKASEGQLLTYNTIETPNGGKYTIILPDGSKVWLNAASSLRFPTAFTGSERIVELSGEAFFDVAKNKDLPFSVKTSDLNITVTGTQFNVMAYTDESYSAATLVEGSVNVSNSINKLRLVPGEQATNKDGTALSKKLVDTEEAIAWKNGLFQFNNSDIRAVMREISRWYDVSIEYKGKIPGAHFGGYISRDSKLSQVIKMLELSGVRFSVKEKKIIVLP